MAKIEISEVVAVKIWDALNEAALNSPSKAYRTNTKRLMKSYEKGLDKAGLWSIKSDHGHA